MIGMIESTFRIIFRLDEEDYPTSTNVVATSRSEAVMLLQQRFVLLGHPLCLIDDVQVD